jgi:hypothetical protein
MSLTPTPLERCGHIAPMAIERATDGYSASCLTHDKRSNNASKLSFSATLGEESEVEVKLV